MEILRLLLPDFSLIFLGVIMRRIPHWGDAFWTGLEKLVYFVLFPSLLFYSTARLKLDLSTSGPLVAAGMLALLCGIALTWLGKPVFGRQDPVTYASGMQTAFRFNSYMALALASRLAGEEGAGLMAMLMGFGVPLCNAAAVHALASKNGRLLAELMRNPLLVATALGLVVAVSGIHIPEVGGVVLSRLASASIPLGLMTVGAGLRLSGLTGGRGMTIWLTAVKLVGIPACAFFIGRWMQLPPLQWRIVVLFGCLPTASSCYILAMRMGGNGPMTAFLVSLGTLLSAITIPVWLALVH